MEALYLLTWAKRYVMLNKVSIAKEQHNKVQVQALSYGSGRDDLVYDW
jgi:hypothetical protein